MPGKLGVLIIHGIGDPDRDFADKLIRRLRRRLGARAAEVELEPCWWAGIMEDAQRVIWDRMRESGKPMRALKLRRKVVSYLGDPPTYLSGYFRDDDPTYVKVHQCVRDSLRKLEARLEPGAPLMVLAHSLGSTIVSNYIWDEQREQGLKGSTPFERMHTLASFITYGSTIPLFVPPNAEVECIRFPPPELPPRYADVARWQNVYDPDDLLGYPLGDIWTERNGTTIEDIDIQAGHALISWTPLSHALYDGDDDFHDVVIGKARQILDVASRGA